MFFLEQDSNNHIFKVHVYKTLIPKNKIKNT